jgi:uncharacterized protein YmfQ (DUF2313 family)
MSVTIVYEPCYPIVSVLDGSSATFTIIATGTSLQYQWYKNTVLIPGETASTYVTPLVYVVPDNKSEYYCTVTDTITILTSSMYQLNVMDRVPVPDSGYGTTEYGYAAYKYGEGPAELHYNVLKKLFPMTNVEGVLDDDLHVEGKNLDDAYYNIGGWPGAQLGDGVLTEVYPDSAHKTLSSWERVFSLSAGTLTDAERRLQIQAAIVARGGLSRDYFSSIAAAMGYSITITEGVVNLFRVGTSAPPATLLPHSLFDPAECYTWHVTVTGVASAPMLEAKFQLLKPAWTIVDFTYV